VLYTGNRRWNAPATLRAMTPGICVLPNRFRPHVRFHLIDARRPRAHASHLKRNLVAALFRMENSQTYREIDDALRSLLATLKGHESASLRRAFSVWINTVILPRLRGGSLDKVPNLQEMRAVLADQFPKWEAQFRASGMRVGQRIGLKKGRRNGHAELLLKQLRRRFGDELPRRVLERVRRADVKQLGRWGEKLLDAQNLAQIFPTRRMTSVPSRRPASATRIRTDVSQAG
jgi:hypothetical protein